MDLIAAVDFIALICSCLSFVFSSSLWFLLWNVRRSKKDLRQKRSATLLTTHVYYMAMCDVLISIWCILTYTPVMMNPSVSLFNHAPSDDTMNEISFINISQNFPCFILAILGQFAVISSALWYIMISYCLWRILLGYNPLSINLKRQSSFVLSTSHIITPRNLKFRKKPDENYKITALKEDVPVDDVYTHATETKASGKPTNDAVSPPNRFLTTPSIAASEAKDRDSLGLSLLSSPKDKEIGWCDSYQNRERQELSRILKIHHIIVWSIALLLTITPFTTGSMGVNISYIGDMERNLECWIGSKFWLFSFYSVISIAVCNGMCMLLFISFKILKNREYKLSKKTSRQRTWRRSRRNYKVLKRFGVFVGCYLLCWILPIIQRFYALAVDNVRDVPDWLILSSEVSIAVFPMANAIVWYTNVSFRKLISKNLVLIVKYDCCCFPFTRRRYRISRSSDLKPSHHEHVKIVLGSNKDIYIKKQTPKQSNSTGGYGTLTNYGSFCDIMDLATYDNYSDPMEVHNLMTEGILSAIGSDGYMDDKELDETIDEDLSFGGTIESVDMNHVKFDKKNVSKHHANVSLSSLRLPSQLSEVFVTNYSSSLSDEMKREHKRYSSDFTDIVAVRSGRNSAITTPVGGRLSKQVITPVIRDDMDVQHATWQCVNQDLNDKYMPAHGFKNHNFVHGLFTDDEEYDDRLKRLQNSIDDFGVEDDDTENDSDNVISDSETQKKSPLAANVANFINK